MKILIIGCSRVGARLAMDAAHEGHQVSIIDSNPRSFRRLPPDLEAVVVLGTGIDEDVLRSAGIETCDSVIAVTDNDNTNIMVAQIAQRIFDVPKVLLRVYDPARAETYSSLGLTVICPTEIVANFFEQELSGFRQHDDSAVLG